MFGRKKKITFTDAIEPLISLLERTGEKHWLSHVRKHRSGGSSFRSIFGGMGSFNDLIVCQANGHAIEKKREALANTWLSCLSSICYALTQQKELSAQDAFSACGSLGHQLQGVRCLECGISHLAPSNLASFELHHRTRKRISEGIEKGNLTGVFEEEWTRFEESEIVAKYKEALDASDIHQSQIFEMMRPCPKCGGNDTAIYRWDWNGKKFTPSVDNLKLRNLTRQSTQRR